MTYSADKAVTNKVKLPRATYTFVPVPSGHRKAGTWRLEPQSSGMIAGAGQTYDSRHYEDTREATYLFQRLSVTLQRGNAVLFHNTFLHRLNAVVVLRLA